MNVCKVQRLQLSTYNFLILTFVQMWHYYVFPTTTPKVVSKIVLHFDKVINIGNSYIPLVITRRSKFYNFPTWFFDAVVLVILNSMLIAGHHKLLTIKVSFKTVEMVGGWNEIFCFHEITCYSFKPLKQNTYSEVKMI